VYLVALSRLVPHKQIEHALDCLAALQRSHPNLRLDVIGDGWWSENLRRYAQELGVDGKVVFHGYVSEELKHRILQRASIHVMPSRKEGWGLAVIEAAQHGVPTVGYESSAGLRDSIVDEETGLLATSPGGLINAVEHLLDDPALCRRMGLPAARRPAPGVADQRPRTRPGRPHPLPEHGAGRRAAGSAVLLGKHRPGLGGAAAAGGEAPGNRTAGLAGHFGDQGASARVSPRLVQRP